MATRSTHLDVTALPGTRMVVYTPVDDESRDRIAWLRDHPEATAPRHRH